MINKNLLVASLALLIAPRLALSEEVPSKSIEMSASQLTAMTTALDRFRSDGNKIGGYYALVVSGKNGTEVAFVPELVRSSNMIGFEKSSKPDIHYYLDTTGLKVIKVLFGQ